MKPNLLNQETSLKEMIGEYQQPAIAVSGGVDSVTLAMYVSRQRQEKIAVFHAVSAAVPKSATNRVRELFDNSSLFDLKIIDAGEFKNDSYLKNPDNRCYYCKYSLYGTIKSYWSGEVLSGTNFDDLSDYRPGLMAASKFEVKHPFVEAFITKAYIRELARGLGLPEVSALPAQPCLASRFATGVPIEPKRLEIVEDIEKSLSRILGPTDLRCRLRDAEFFFEISAERLRRLTQGELSQVELIGRSAATLLKVGFSGIRTYQRGSMSIRVSAEGV